MTTVIGIATLAAIAGAGWTFTRASSHREAPLISGDPLADNTDLYTFVSPSNPDRVTLIANFIPFEAPYGGPNFFKFDDNVLYEIMIDNNGDARRGRDVPVPVPTRSSIPTPSSTTPGPSRRWIRPNFNVRQIYSVTRVDGPRRRGASQVLATDLPTPPVNVGLRSTPNYDALAAAAVRQLPNSTQVFAGQRDDPFFVDLNVFDLLAVPPADTNNSDSLAGFNVHTIAIEVPITSLTANGTRPASGDRSQRGDRRLVHGQPAVGHEPRRRRRRSHVDAWVQVSRLGQPLVNEVVIPRGAKDTFNALEPTGDARGAADS